MQSASIQQNRNYKMRLRGNNNNEFDMFFNMMQRVEDQHQHKLNDLRNQINALKEQKSTTEVSDANNSLSIYQYGVYLLTKSQIRRKMAKNSSKIWMSNIKC